MISYSTIIFSSISILCALSTFCMQAQSVWSSKKSSWIGISSADKTTIEDFSKKYTNYLYNARTELSSTKELIEESKKKGFTIYSKLSDIKPGAKLLFINRDRALIACIIGAQPFTQGSRLIAAHHDSPRIDIKARPLYEIEGFAMFQTIYYGGIKKYQWANLPLMISGRIDTKDGKTTWIDIGKNPEDPVFVIPDAAPHVDSPLRNRTYTGVLEGEELDPVIGSIPDDKNSVFNGVMSLLHQQFGFQEEDFVSAELHITPASPPREIGFDRGLIGSYGQDDRSCSFAAMHSLLSLNATPEFTSLAYIVDNEETGNVNNTGAASIFLNSVYSIISEATTKQQFNTNITNQALHNALVISADANDGISPLFPGLSEKSNAAKLGFGICIKRYGRSFDANSEFTAKIRNLLDLNVIPWQTVSYKVETGGGGTIGGQMSKDDMNVIDIGIPLLSMHSPFEISSKIDLWNLNKFFTVFYSSK